MEHHVRESSVQPLLCRLRSRRFGTHSTDDAFYEMATEGAAISIHVRERVVDVGGRHFPFVLSEIEENLTGQGGIAAAYNHFGTGLWERLTALDSKKECKSSSIPIVEEGSDQDKRLEW